MPPRSGKIRHAKLGPRFSETANNQSPRFFRDGEDILGHLQHYLQGRTDEQENQTVPSPHQAATGAPQPAAQAHAPAHWPTQSSSTSSPASTFTPPLLRYPPSPAPQLGGSFEFPAFHLTIPPSPSRTSSPPFKHPSVLLNPNTVPYQVAPRTGPHEPGHVFQPAPRRPIDHTSGPTNLSTFWRPSMAPDEPRMAPTIQRPDSTPAHQADNSPDVFRAIIEDNLPRTVFGINQSHNRDNPNSITSDADAEALSWFHLSILCKGATINKYLKERFSCTADQGWVDDIIKSDYWLTDILDSGLWKVQHPDQWRPKVQVSLEGITGVALWAKLRYAIVQDPFLYDGKKCAPSFIWIVLLMRHILVSLPYAQHLGVLDRLKEKELDPCDTAFVFFTLCRVVVELMDTITFRYRGANLPKVPHGQQNVLSTCDSGHLRITMQVGSDFLSQFNDEMHLSAPEGIDFTNAFKNCFMETLEEIDDDCLTSLVVARSTHPPGFFSLEPSDFIAT